jgi:hypothetical protein
VGGFHGTDDYSFVSGKTYYYHGASKEERRKFRFGRAVFGIGFIEVRSKSEL